MPFWTYMLHCADRSFYVGHTDDLELRLAQHGQGTLDGYTQDRRPVKLVWCNEFPSRYEALAAERQIKGWSRARKMALIRNDWEALRRLVLRREQKGGASTSSARTGGGAAAGTGEGNVAPNTVRPGPVEGHSFLSNAVATRLPLKLHPDCHCPAVAQFDIEVLRPSPVSLHLRYRLSCNTEDLAMPAPAAPRRSDELWQHTCFEAFLRRPSERDYCEFNFAPSNLWAAYRFDGYRSGMEPLEIQPPRIETDSAADCLELRAEIDLPGQGPWQLALSAVIEEKNGRKSYWALAHPAAKPDFHHPDSFVHELS